MRTPASPPADPWTPDIDAGWKDLVVSSAPPPPPHEAVAPPKSPMLPLDLRTWQEHGTAHGAVVEPVDEPSFTAGDRRMWWIAGTLMTLAVAVLAMLGLLTFSGKPLIKAAVEPVRASEPPRAAEPSRAAELNNAVAAATRTAAVNPRTLKRTKHARHHKRLAER